VRPEAVELEYGVYGKPVLAPRFAASGLRFNVSHCDDVAGVLGQHRLVLGPLLRDDMQAAAVPAPGRSPCCEIGGDGPTPSRASSRARRRSRWLTPST